MKSLVEELREFEGDDCSLYRAVTGNNDCCCIINCSECVEVIANALADRIEREYLPKPLFEDGEPVKEGDTIKTEYGKSFKVLSYSVTDEGKTAFYGEHGGYIINTCERVKRPKRAVLDADCYQDSLERIKEDALKSFADYWKCTPTCGECRTKIGCKTPDDYYDTFDCVNAMNLDLINRTIKVMEVK